ncbi:DDE-type integrase/transposase/recombinase [Leisingera sp. F5]|uniref:DDE-type integrase/transposase/recombinase n=1 Tax=Leisingera sp. F5 TaxID=1813816 RepID=UPI00345C2A59
MKTIRLRSVVRLGGKQHLDEVVISIGGGKHWPWRAVDQEEFVLDVLVQARRERQAALGLKRKLLSRQCLSPRVLLDHWRCGVSRTEMAQPAPSRVAE